MKRIFTFLAAAAMTLTVSAQAVGEYVYTSNGKFKITSENLLSNGNFAQGTTDWTSDGGRPLQADTFSVETGTGPDGGYSLLVLSKENGPGTGSSLLRTVPVDAGQTYVVSYQVKGNEENTTSTIVTGASVKNYQNIFFNTDGSTTPAQAIATNQTYGFDWTTVSYGFTASETGYLVIHFYAPYVSTEFANFQVVRAAQVIDDREANAVIARLQAYLSDERFPNGHDVLEGVIGAIQAFVESDDLAGYNDIIAFLDEAIKSFLDVNTADITSYLKNGNFDDLPTTSANQTKAGGWTIDDGLRVVNPTGKTRWAVKSAVEMGVPMTGNYLQNDIPYGTNNKLYEATVHQTVTNMPAAEYMFSIKLRGYKLLNKAGDRTSEIRGMKVFINSDSTECYPVDSVKATDYTTYSKLAETGSLKVGFYLPDAVANHIDLDVTALRIVGWTQEQLDEYMGGKEFAEARQSLKHSIDSARTHYDNPEMLYGKPQLDSAIIASQNYYDNIAIVDSLNDSNTRLLKEISNYISRNSTLTAFRTAIANAEEMLSDERFAETDRQTLQAAIDAAKAYLGTLTADNHLTEGTTNADIQAQTTLLNKAANALLATLLKADEKYEFLNWAQADGAEYTSNLAETDEDAITTTSGATLYPEIGEYAGHDLNKRFVFRKDIIRSMSTSHGLQVNYTGKNTVIMAIADLKEGDQVDIDWVMGNATHSMMIVSANAKVKLADGDWQEYTKTGKDNANVLPKDNANGLSGAVRSTLIMTKDGTLDFYQSSTNSTMRIYYVGLTNAENVDGIADVQTDSRTATGIVYDLQGRRLNQKPAKGMYILNGRKYFVK